jgi:CRISPR-associated protein Csx10
VDAFNAKLGLPRTRDIAIVAGSCVRLSFTGIELPELVTILEKAEGQGIGLRRDEGFGRVAFNHPVHERNLATWSASALSLSPLVLGGSTQESHPTTALIQFTLDWIKKLDDEFKSGASKFNDERFEVAARLLHASQKASAKDVKQEMQRMGKMDELLPQALKGRDKKNFFETDGKNGMEMIDRLLDEMASLIKLRMPAHNPQAWRIGLQMLASRIAELARQNAQERR